MNRYLLDSDTLSALFDTTNPSHHAATSQLAALSNSDAVGLSILTLCELEYSQWGFSEASDKARIKQFIQRCTTEFTVVGVNTQTAQIYGQLKYQFKVETGASTKSMRRHNVDIMLAATAIATKSFSVSGDQIFTALTKLDSRLKYRNWLACH